MIERSLASSTLFGSLPLDVVRRVAETSTELRLEPGEAIFHQGDESDAIFLVIEGDLVILSETDGKSRRTLDMVRCGESVGELGVLGESKRSASVCSVGVARVIRVPAEACRAHVLSAPLAAQIFIESAQRRRPSYYLRVNPIFVGLDPEIVQSLDERAEWIRLKAGEILFHAGDASDALYVVAHGSLEPLVGPSSGGTSQATAPRLAETITRGASVGELGVLSGNPRSVTVRAIRDSELIRLSESDFNAFLDQHPVAGRNLSRVLASRLQKTTWSPQTSRTVRTVAVIPAGASPLPGEFVRELAAALSSLVGSVLRVGRDMIERQLAGKTSSRSFDASAGEWVSHWLSVQETAHTMLIYEGEPGVTDWTRCAIRQADLVLIVGSGGESPPPGPLQAFLAGGDDSTRARRELVLLHPAGTLQPRGTAAWLNAFAVAGHHHLRAGDSADHGRLARAVTGRSVGIALSGGGARGFSHIGALRALRERGMAVDVVGGTSMGSVIAAQQALGWTTEMMIERNRKAFLACPVWGDLTLPMVSLLTGRGSVDLLREMFGEVQIEDLWLPYFCVSTNLSRAELMVHDRGPLWFWQRASCSVPGINPPVPCHGDLLVDGGVMNNLPVDVLKKRCTGSIIASDAGMAVNLPTRLEGHVSISGWSALGRILKPWSTNPTFPKLFEVLTRTAEMNSEQTLERCKRDADLYLHPSLTSVAGLDWGAIERAADIGYRHACEQLDIWQKSPPPNHPHDP